MTKRTRPSSLHALMAHAAGMPMAKRELDAWLQRPGSTMTLRERALRNTIAKTKDRPLTDDEAKGLRIKRVNQAATDRANPSAIDTRYNPTRKMDIPFLGEGRWPIVNEDGTLKVAGDGRERTVSYYRRAVRRLERWAMRAERLGLDKGRPPESIARMAMDVVQMTQVEGAKA